MTKRLEDIQQRHAAIKAVIAELSIPNQRELVAALKRRGIRVTQATLSRDLTELGIVRVPHDNGSRYELRPTGAEEALKSHVAEEIVSVCANETAVVVRTFPGRAQGVALLLDRQQDAEILGTIAGDDTIVVIPRSTKTIRRTIQQVKFHTGVR